MNLLVDDIGELLTIKEAPGDALGIVHDAAVLIVDRKVVYAGPASALARGSIPKNVVRLDAGGRLVTPGLVDPHAHPIFAGSRAAEFDLRAQKKSYLEIQQAGGGILSTVRATLAASDEELVDSTLARLDRFLSHGVTTVEAKSGYALTIEGELRLLELLGRVRDRHPIDLSPTLLAHVPPPELDEKERAAFVVRFASEATPAAARRGLCEAVDVYCDAGAFTLDETRQILEAGARAGLALRAHAEQFTHSGAAELAASLGARSVEHLEQLAEAAPALLARAGTVCNLLPGAALTLKLAWPDARRLIDAGCRVALGTDCNPGSSLTESLPLMMSLAVTQMGMSCAEAWRAVTREAAHAVGRADSGRLDAGARGDLVIWNASDHREVAQHLGARLADVVVVGGRPVVGGPQGS
ncbi:MAG TPA: imidazolonepropionase [Polyangia bacterium]